MSRRFRIMSLLLIVAVVGLLATDILPVPRVENDGGDWRIVVGPESASAGVEVDYTCNGSNDNSSFQAALDALPSIGGEVHFLVADYDFNLTVSRAIDNVTIIGLGNGSFIGGNGSMSLFSAGSQSGWTFKDFATDAGGIDVSGASSWLKQNVREDSTYYGWEASSDRKIDHGGLADLSDDDHTQYVLVNGTRAMTGHLNLDLVGSASGQVVRTGDSNASLALKGSSINGAQISIQGRDHVSGGQIMFFVVNSTQSGLQQSLTLEGGDTAIAKFYGDIYFQGDAGEVAVIKRYDEDDAYLSIQGGDTHSAKIELTGKDHAFGGDIRQYVTNTANNGTQLALQLDDGDSPLATFFGNIVVPGTVDGVDVSAIPSTYLPLAGGTMAGDIVFSGGEGINSTLRLGSTSMYRLSADDEYIVIYGGATIGTSGAIVAYGPNAAGILQGSVRLNVQNTAADGNTVGLQIARGDNPNVTLYGNLVIPGTVDGVDVSAIPTTYLPLAGGTMAGTIYLPNGNGIGSGDSNVWYMRGGAWAAGSGTLITMTGKSHGGAGKLHVATPNATGTADQYRLEITGMVDTATATWTNVEHTGLVLSGALNAGSQSITSVAGMTVNGNFVLSHTGESNLVALRGGPNAAGSGAYLLLQGHANTGSLALYTSNATGDADQVRLTLSGATDIATATWANVEHTGFVSSGSLIVDGVDIKKSVTNSYTALIGGSDAASAAIIVVGSTEGSADEGDVKLFVEDTAGTGRALAMRLNKSDMLTTLYGDIKFSGASANMIDRDIDNGYLHIEGGIVGANKSGRIFIYGWNGGANSGDIVFSVPNVAHTSHVEVMRIDGMSATPAININYALAIGGNLDMNSNIAVDVGIVEKEIFLPAEMYTGGTQTSLGYSLADSALDDGSWMFKAPADYVSDPFVELVWQNSAGNETGHLYGQWLAYYGADGQSWSTHTDTPGYDIMVTAGTGINNVDDGAAPLTLSSFAVGDYVQIKYQRNSTSVLDTIDSSVLVSGILFSYNGTQVETS